MDKIQQILFESLATYGIMKDKPCKLDFDKNVNPNNNVESLYPSIVVNIDRSRFVPKKDKLLK